VGAGNPGGLLFPCPRRRQRHAAADLLGEMQRYAGAGNSNSSGFTGGPVPGSGRENSSRLEASPYAPPSYPVNPRRQQQLAPYRLKCDKEPLNNKLGPPDFYPQTPNCPEETLTKEYVQSGYKETVDGIEEAREIVLSNISYFCKPDIVVKCKEVKLGQYLLN